MAYKDLIIKLEKRFGLENSLKQPRYNLVMRARLRMSSWRSGRIGSCPWLLEPLGFTREPHVPTRGSEVLPQGAADKEAGSYASNIRPKNIEEAINKRRWHQHNHQAIYGRPPRRKVKQVSPGSYNGVEARVFVIGANTGEMSLKKEMGEVLSAQGKEMGEIKFNLAVLSVQMAVMMEEVKKRGKGSPKGKKRVPFQETKGALNYQGATHEA